MSLIADHFDICDRCNGYVITSGVYRYMMRNSPHLCRCEEPNEEIPSESQCRLGGNQHAGRKVSVAGLVSRRAGARSPAATSELMDVTAGETAPTPVRRKLTITTELKPHHPLTGEHLLASGESCCARLPNLPTRPCCELRSAQGARGMNIPVLHPITATVRPLTERLWILHQRCAAGVITESEEAELNVLCALAEQQYLKGREAANNCLPSE